MNGKIIVNGAEITVTTIDDKDYISLTLILIMANSPQLEVRLA